MKKIVSLGIGLFFIATVIGCNATKGAGKDLENAGESIQKTVDKKRLEGFMTHEEFETIIPAVETDWDEY